MIICKSKLDFNSYPKFTHHPCGLDREDSVPLPKEVEDFSLSLVYDIPGNEIPVQTFPPSRWFKS